MNLPSTYENPALVATAGEGMQERIRTAEDDRLNFRDFVNLLQRRLKLFIAVVAGTLILGILVTSTQPRIYEADAVVLLRDSGQKLEERVNNREQEAPMEGDADVSTEIQVIGSLDLARRVTRSLDLVNNPKINPMLAPEPSLLQRLFGGAPEPVDIAKLNPRERQDMENRVVQSVRSGLGATRIGTSYSVEISYRHHDPEMAALLANSFAHAYATTQVANEQQAVGEATDFLSRKVEELRRQATTDFAAVQNYRISNGLLSNSATALTEQDISVYNQQTASARAEAAADAARVATARRQLYGGSAGDDVGEALASSVVSALRTQRAQIGARVADLSTRYGDRHPDLQRAKEELASVDRQIQEEINRVISNLEAKSAVSAQRLASLSSTLASAKGDLARNNGDLVTLEDLQRRAQASQSLYESYLQRYRTLAASSGTEQPEARVLTEAIPPNSPTSPKVLLNLLLAGMCGLVLGLVAALAAELQFKGLTTSADVEKRVGLPFLGLTPENNSMPDAAATPLETLTERPDSVLAETVRGIYTATQIPGGGGTVLAVSSALPAEGKTTLAAMLALTAGKSGKRTVVVDCDIVLRGLTHLFHAGDGAGLSELASGAAPLEAALRTIGGGNTWLLPITSPAEPGQRLTGNAAIQAVVGELRTHFDLVLLDCPPLLAIAEAREIAALADGVILVARWRKTKDASVRAAARLLPPRLANYVGIVLSRVDLRKQQRYAADDSATYQSAYKHYMPAAA